MTGCSVENRRRIGTGRAREGARGVDPVRRRRPKWPARRRWWIAAAMGMAIAGTLIGVVLWCTPLLSVRHIDVDGAAMSDDIVAKLGVPLGTPLLRVDTVAAAGRVGSIARIARARVRRDFPSTIRVDVTERIAIAYIATSTEPHLLDSDGVEFVVGALPPGLPRLQTPHPGPSDPVTLAAMKVLGAAPTPLRSMVKTIVAQTISDITLILRDGRSIQWGGTDRSDRKALIVLSLLTRSGHSYDVSSPDLPTVRQ